MTQLYKIEELFTDGWELIHSSAQKLTREECSKKLQRFMSEGHNPNYIRVVADGFSEE